jgi:hypothetical protein
MILCRPPEQELRPASRVAATAIDHQLEEPRFIMKVKMALPLAVSGCLAVAGCASWRSGVVRVIERLDPLVENLEPRAQTGAQRRMESPEYGVHGFLWWRPETAERDLRLASEMGFTWVKQLFAWRDIELRKDEFDWSRSDRIVEQAELEGLRLVIRIDHQPEWARPDCPNGPPANLSDLADYVGAVAARYRGRVGAYEIWNEPNLAREWCGQVPDPAVYADMLAMSYEAIKRADQEAYVISAGLSPTGTGAPLAMPDDEYLDALYTAIGGPADGYFDVLGVHAPGYRAAPEVGPDEAAASAEYGSARYFTFRRVEDLRAIMVAHGDAQRQVAVLEMGWTSDQVHPEYAWHAVSEEQKAEYLVRAFEFARQNWAPWIGLMTVIYLANPDWTPADEQYWWAITEPDGTPRPAYSALQLMPKISRVAMR